MDPSIFQTTDFQCDQCSSSFEYKSSLILHKLSHKKEAKPEIKDEPIEIKEEKNEEVEVPLFNFIITKVSDNKVEIKQETIEELKVEKRKKKKKYNWAVKSNPYDALNTCILCGKTYVSRSNYLAHQLFHEKKIQRDINQLSCELCPKKFGDNFSLECHKNTAHSSVSYNCKFCGFKAFTKMSLRNHSFIHRLLLPCARCNLKFLSFGDLKDHSRAYHSISITRQQYFVADI
jgi:transcription elongation factor Elf1